MNQEINIKWNKALQFIKENMGSDKFDTWVKCATLIDYSDSTLVVELPSDFYAMRWEHEYYDIISTALRKEFSPDVKLKYNVLVLSNDEGSKMTISSQRQSPLLKNPVYKSFQNDKRSDDGATIDSQLNEALTFENYCRGESNKLPLTIAEFIANNPEKAEFNPFFLYGKVGVGKTHLIQAIGTRIKERNPRAKVLFTTMRQFQNQYATATLKGKVPNFINWYQQLDVIIFDDLQELSHKSGTAEALFPIFNHLHQNKKKLIFSCDRPPIELDGLADRLIDRFKWGITEELPKPDYELKKSILKFKSAKEGLSLSDEVIDLIAGSASESVRELEGIVMGILTRAISFNCEITPQLAMDVMKHTIRPAEKKNVNFDMIVETTAEYFNLNPDVLFSKSRQRDIAEARQVIMYLCNKMTSLSTTAIGNKLNRAHTTVMFGINAIKERLPYAKDLSNLINQIEEDILS